MAHTPKIYFTLTTETKCHVCDTRENVLIVKQALNGMTVNEFPSTCVVCLSRLLDVPMEWRLSNTVIQTLAHRAKASELRDDQDALIARLPPELRKKRKA